MVTVAQSYWRDNGECLKRRSALGLVQTRGDSVTIQRAFTLTLETRT